MGQGWSEKDAKVIVDHLLCKMCFPIFMHYLPLTNMIYLAESRRTFEFGIWFKIEISFCSVKIKYSRVKSGKESLSHFDFWFLLHTCPMSL